MNLISGFFETKSLLNYDECIILNLNGMNFVSVKYGVKEMLFLLDTGASVSVIFSECLLPNECINKSKNIKIQGISGSTFSVGTAKILFLISDVKIKHDFLVVDKFIPGIQGVLGSDFFVKYSANINYETCLFSFYHNTVKKSIPMLSNSDYCLSIPPRSEVIKFCKVDYEGDCVILSEELCDGVFVASIIAKAENGEIAVRFLNVNEREVSIKNFKPKVEHIQNFQVYDFNKSNHLSVERVDKVLDLIDMSSLNKEEKNSIEKICAKYADIFHLEGDPLTVTNLYKQKIHLKKDATSVYVKPYRLPQSQKSEIQKQVRKMQSEGIIEEATSEFSSPLLIVPKKCVNGEKKFRVVIDYRLLNKQVRDEKMPLPCIAEILDSLSGAIYFSHLDLSQGYYQLELHKDSRPYTAFTTNEGQFQMKRLPMGLKISPSVFSRLMSVAFSGLNYESCFIYLDDLIIFGNSLQQHNRNLVNVFERLRKVNLKLNPTKCDFLKKQILYLGHLISSEGISPDPQKSETISRYPIPQNADESKRFVAFANYYRKFIKNFAQIAQPLNELSRKGHIFNWNENCQQSFDTLKHALINPPVLQYPDFSENNNFILKTDASGYALGSVLCNNNDMPIAYASRVLNKAEKNYCTIEKELLAIVWSVKHFRPYLYGKKFQIFTDHRPLVYLFSMTNPSSRLTKFRLILEEYDFSIHYIRGSHNVTADALSRIKLDLNELKEMNAGMHERINVITRAQAKNKSVPKQGNLINSTEERLDHPGLVELLRRPLNSIELRLIDRITFNTYKRKIDHGYIHFSTFIYNEISKIIYFCLDFRSTHDLGTSLRNLGTLCTKYKITELCIIKNSQTNQFIVDLAQYKNDVIQAGIKICILKHARSIDCKETRQLILNDFHNLSTSGHAGINRMFNNIKKYYFWPGLKKDVEAFVKKCDDCQRYKYSIISKQPLTITSTATVAFQKVYLDLVGPIKPDCDNNSYILTIQCELSKFIECYPLPTKEALVVAKSFVEQFILRYGIPQDIVTDQGKEFLANVFQESCKLLGINTLNSTAYHHETLGALEKSHKHLGAYLRMQVSKHTDNWSTWVPYWCFAYNNTVHTETKYCPFELVFGKLSHIPSNLVENIDPLYNFHDYPYELKYRIQTGCHEARNNLLESKTKRKQKFDKNCNSVSYNIGDKVLLVNENASSKLDPLYIGPYEVVKDVNPNIILNINEKHVTVHKNRVKLYNL